VEFIDALEAERQGHEEALELAKTDRIRRRKQGGASTVMSDGKQTTSAIAIHRQDITCPEPN